MHWRTPTADDVPALTRAFAAVEAVDRTGEHFSEADVRVEFDDATDAIAAFTTDGEVAAYAHLHGKDPVKFEGAVVPSARRQGLGRRLLDWAQERAPADVPLAVDVHETNPGNEALVRGAGFQPACWWYTMTHPLEPLPEIPPVPAGLALVPYDRERDEAVRLAHREAFADHWGFDPPDADRWARRYTGMPAFQPDASLLVLDGDEVAAFLLTAFWEADAAASGVREAFVGQLGVRPTWRRRGLGGLLLAAALAGYAAAGYDRSLLTVDTRNATGALGLYERAGYTVRERVVTWTR